MRTYMTTLGLVTALVLGSANASFAQGSTADTTRAINGPANSETANQDARKQIHGHAAHHRRTSAAHYGVAAERQRLC